MRCECVCTSPRGRARPNQAGSSAQQQHQPILNETHTFRPSVYKEVGDMQCPGWWILADGQIKVRAKAFLPCTCLLLFLSQRAMSGPPNIAGETICPHPGCAEAGLLVFVGVNIPKAPGSLTRGTQTAGMHGVLLG